MSDLAVYDYQVYPPERTLIDKACATVKTYPNGRSSSRIKDLADMVAILLREKPDLSDLAGIIAQEKILRGLPRDTPFAIPSSWFETMPRKYRTMAIESGLPEAYQDIHAAAEYVEGCLKDVF